MSPPSDKDIFLTEQAPAVLLRLEVCRRLIHIVRERREAGKPEPSMELAMPGIGLIKAPTLQPFYVPAVLSALIDVRKICCFFGYSVNKLGELINYTKQAGDFDVRDLCIPQPNVSEFLGILSTEGVTEDNLKAAYIATVTYSNKALAHYKVGRLQEQLFENYIVTALFGVDRALRILVYKKLGVPEPKLPINDL